MSFPRYPKYKDSGVEWLGEVPRHWNVAPLKHVIRKIESGTSVNSTDVPAGEGELGVLKTSCVYSGAFEAGENKAVVPEEYDRVTCPVTAGTLVVSRMNTPDLVGAAGLVQKSNDALFLPDRLWQVAFTDAEPAYVHYWTLTGGYRAQVQTACAGTSSSMQNLAQDQFRGFVFPKPTSDEQSAIAAFLDHETAKLDELMAEQEKLIALLKEKRQAVIAHAVTKGLDPTVPMKYSGVEWLGEVPEHWSVIPLGALASMIQTGPFGSQLHSEDYLDDETPVINPSNIRDGKVVPDWSCTVGNEIVERLTHHQLKRGDIVFGRRGEMGRCAMITENEAGWLCGTGSLNVRLASKASAEFVSVYLATSYVRELLKLESVGSTMDNLNGQILSRIPVPNPPLDEQIAIANFLGSESARMAELIQAAEQAIDLLKERRTALISAAVTGQIDVRGLIKDEQEQAA